MTFSIRSHAIRKPLPFLHVIHCTAVVWESTTKKMRYVTACVSVFSDEEKKKSWYIHAGVCQCKKRKRIEHFLAQQFSAGWAQTFVRYKMTSERADVHTP